MVLAFVLVLVMKELPLRTKSALDERLEEQARGRRRWPPIRSTAEAP